MTYTAPSVKKLNVGVGTDAQVLQGELSKIATEFNGGLKVAKGTLTKGNANAFAFAWQNPESSKIIITRVFIRLATAGGTATSVLDIGIVTGPTATADTLIDGLDLNTTGLFDNVTQKGTNGLTMGIVDEKGGTKSYITGKILTANAAALAGNYYILYTVV